MNNSLQEIIAALFGEAPFFEGATHGYQGTIQRHVFMIAAINFLAEFRSPIKVLEIGSWIGLSALTFSQAIAEYSREGGSVLCVDAWRQYFNAEDTGKADVYKSMSQLARSDIAYNLFLHNIRFADSRVKIDHMRGLSREIVPRLAGKTFDLIYIDGSHYYEDVLNDLNSCAPLLRDGGVLCGDDLECQTGEFDAMVARQHAGRDEIVDPKSGRRFHPGVALAVGEFFGRRISSHIGFWAVQKKGDAYHDIHLDGRAAFIPRHFNETARRMCEQFLKR